jgi:hypothetical protein
MRMRDSAGALSTLFSHAVWSGFTEAYLLSSNSVSRCQQSILGGNVVICTSLIYHNKSNTRGLGLGTELLY